MRVTSVTLSAEGSSNQCVLSYRDPGSTSPYLAKSITGLDADDIVPRFYGSSASNAKYYSLSLQKRDVIFQMVLNPRYAQFESHSGLRDELYRLISSSRTGVISVEFKDGPNSVAIIYGFVSKLETDHFDKEPSVKLAVTCDDPMLRSVAPANVSVLGLDPASTVITDNLSTAPHGLSFNVIFTDSQPDFTMTDTEDEWSFSIVPVGGFLRDDVLHVSSDFNNKEVYIVRDSEIIYLADVIIAGSIWPVLFPGENTFICSPNFVWDTISYYVTYWGV